jgi:hypothetical protein
LNSILEKFDNVAYDLEIKQIPFFKNLNINKQKSTKILEKLDDLLENVEIFQDNLNKYLFHIDKSTKELLNSFGGYNLKIDSIVKKVYASILEKQKEYGHLVELSKNKMINLNNNLIKSLKSNKVQKFKIFNFDSFLNFGSIFTDHKVISALGLLSIGGLFFLKKIQYQFNFISL